MTRRKGEAPMLLRIISALYSRRCKVRYLGLARELYI